MPTPKKPDAFAMQDFSQFMPKFDASGGQFAGMLETQRKNVQALNSAQHIVMEGLQSVMRMQAEIAGLMVSEQTEIAKELMADGSPEDKLLRQTDMVKKHYETTITRLKKLNDEVTKTQHEATQIINKRVSASLNEMKDVLDKARS